MKIMFQTNWDLDESGVGDGRLTCWRGHVVRANNKIKTS